MLDEVSELGGRVHAKVWRVLESVNLNFQTLLIRKRSMHARNVHRQIAECGFAPTRRFESENRTRQICEMSSSVRFRFSRAPFALMSMFEVILYRRCREKLADAHAWYVYRTELHNGRTGTGRIAAAVGHRPRAPRFGQTRQHSSFGFFQWSFSAVALHSVFFIFFY